MSSNPAWANLPPQLRSLFEEFVPNPSAPVVKVPKVDGAVKAVLSIDGGGLRGCIPGAVLVYLEAAIKEVLVEERARWPGLIPEDVKSQKDFHIELFDCFDFFCGTSVGTWFTSLLSCRGADLAKIVPGPWELKPGSAASLAGFMMAGALMFKDAGAIQWDSYADTGKNLSSAMDKMLDTLYGDDRTMTSLGKDSYFCCTDLTGINSMGFWSSNGKCGTHNAMVESHGADKRDIIEDRHFKLWHVVRASSAQPALCFPFLLESIPPTAPEKAFKSVMGDGVLSANNPTSMGLAWYLKSNPSVKPDKIAVLNLGTTRSGAKFTSVADSFPMMTHPGYIWNQFALNSNPHAMFPEAFLNAFTGEGEAPRFIRIGAVFPGLGPVDADDTRSKEDYEREWNAVWTGGDLNSLYGIGARLGKDYFEDFKAWARSYVLGLPAKK